MYRSNKNKVVTGLVVNKFHVLLEYLVFLCHSLVRSVSLSHAVFVHCAGVHWLSRSLSHCSHYHCCLSGSLHHSDLPCSQVMSVMGDVRVKQLFAPEWWNACCNDVAQVEDTYVLSTSGYASLTLVVYSVIVLSISILC